MGFITVPFDRAVDRKAFDCKTHPALNQYIAEQAGQDEKRSLSRTFMLLDAGQLIGYYTLANAALAVSDLDAAMVKRMPRYPMPAIMLSRLAVDHRYQGNGTGKRLMLDFFQRAYLVSKHSGIAFIIVDAKDDDAARYYQSLGFLPTPASSLRLVLPTATLFQAFAEEEARIKAEEGRVSVDLE